MIQVVAVLITAGLVIGGLVEGGFIGEDEPTSAGSVTAEDSEGAAGAGQGDEPAPPRDRGKVQTGKPGTKHAGDSPTLELYCATNAQLEQVQAGFFEELEQRTDATTKDLRAAQEDFIQENQGLFGEVRQLAPRAIRADVGTLQATTLAQAGVRGREPSSKEQQAAEQRIEQFEQRNC